MKRSTSLFLLAGLTAVGYTPPCLADTAPALTTSGYIDFYYSLIRPKPPASAAASGQYQNEFGFNLVELTVKRTTGDTTALVDFDFGEQADNAAVGDNGQVDEVSKNIGQAILTYTPSSLPRLTLSAGKMYSNVGWEGPKAKDDWNQSRALLTVMATPVWHVGASAGVAVVPDQLSVTAYVFNGWDTLHAPNDGKTIGAQVAYHPVPSVALTYNGLGGPEQKDDDRDKKILQDSSLTWTGEVTAFAFDYAWGTSAHDTLPDGSRGNAKWSAWEAAVKVNATEAFYVSPRVEQYWDPQGYTSGQPGRLEEGTLTLGYELTTGLETRLEGRRDLGHEAKATGIWALLYTF